MGTIDFLALGIWIVCLSLANLLAFFTLLINAAPKFSWLFWIVFYFTMAGLSYFLFIIFFPEIFLFKESFSSIDACAWLTLFFIAVSYYFSGVWLGAKNKTHKKIGKIITIVSLVCLFLITVESVNIRFSKDIVTEEIVEEPCVIDSIATK